MYFTTKIRNKYVLDFGFAGALKKTYFLQISTKAYLSSYKACPLQGRGGLDSTPDDNKLHFKPNTVCSLS